MAVMRSSWGFELMAQMSVFLSRGSPVLRVLRRSFSFRMISEWMLSWTRRREPAQQTWPWLKKIPLMMPSTAWSMAASSKMMLAPFPPSSRVRRLEEPASSRWIHFPTAVEPVKAILAAAGCFTMWAPVSLWPVTMFTTPGGRPASAMSWANFRAVMEVVGAGYDDGVAECEGWGELPGEHEEGKVPRDDLADGAEGAEVAAGCGVVEFIGPAGVVEEVGGGHGDVEVARFGDGFAAVYGLGDGELAGSVLEEAGEAVEVFAAFWAGELGPGGEGFLGRGEGGMDIRGVGEGDF